VVEEIEEPAMKKIAFSGTLDPITNGHMWVIGEARTMAEEVIVFLSENPFKKPQFGADQRKRVIEESVAQRGWSNVRVLIVKGDYTARAAKQHGIDYLIRGIRSTADFDYENLIQQTNVALDHEAVCAAPGLPSMDSGLAAQRVGGPVALLRAAGNSGVG
jgi:pantetheine-phosphate adenylyltransferase